MDDQVNIEEIKDNLPMGVTEDDKIWAAVGWVFWIVAILALLMEDKKEREFVKYHAWHSIVTGIIFSIITTVTFGCGFPIFIISLFYAYKAYQGETPNIPVITDFIKGQGWA